MNHPFPTLKAEILKVRHASILWITALAFGLGPLMGAIFMLMMKDPAAFEASGTLGTKAQLMNFTADWASYFNILNQALAVGGVLVFGFVISWIFGREYVEDTAKDLLALPSSRTSILKAKFMVYLIWCLGLTLLNLLLCLLIGSLIDLPGFTFDLLIDEIAVYFLTAFLTLLLGAPLAWMAVWSKGYLAPLGLVVLVLVLAQIVAATGYGHYFPWAIPGMFSGAGGDYREKLDFFSYSSLFLTGLLGYGAAWWYWKYADQTK
jgi:ABC-2 type transport system permease protein